MAGVAVRVVLDTHAILWAMAEPAKLGRHAREVFGKASRENLILSDISLLEISMLSAKGRITCQDGIYATLQAIQDKVSILPISAAIAARAMNLQLPHGDPFDRVIVASAMELRVPLCSRDRFITKSALVQVIW